MFKFSNIIIRIISFVMLNLCVLVIFDFVLGVFLMSNIESMVMIIEKMKIYF